MSEDFDSVSEYLRHVARTSPDEVAGFAVAGGGLYLAAQIGVLSDLTTVAIGLLDVGTTTAKFGVTLAMIGVLYYIGEALVD